MQTPLSLYSTLTPFYDPLPTMSTYRVEVARISLYTLNSAQSDFAQQSQYIPVSQVNPKKPRNPLDTISSHTSTFHLYPSFPRNPPRFSNIPKIAFHPTLQNRAALPLNHLAPLYIPRPHAITLLRWKDNLRKISSHRRKSTLEPL